MTTNNIGRNIHDMIDELNHLNNIELQNATTNLSIHQKSKEEIERKIAIGSNVDSNLIALLAIHIKGIHDAANLIEELKAAIQKIKTESTLLNTYEFPNYDLCKNCQAKGYHMVDEYVERDHHYDSYTKTGRKIKEKCSSCYNGKVYPPFRTHCKTCSYVFDSKVNVLQPENFAETLIDPKFDLEIHDLENKIQTLKAEITVAEKRCCYEVQNNLRAKILELTKEHADEFIQQVASINEAKSTVKVLNVTISNHDQSIDLIKKDKHNYYHDLVKNLHFPYYIKCTDRWHQSNNNLCKCTRTPGFIYLECNDCCRKNFNDKGLNVENFNLNRILERISNTKN